MFCLPPTYSFNSKGKGVIGALANYKTAFKSRQSISYKLKSPLFIWLDSQNRVKMETKLEVENSS